MRKYIILMMLLTFLTAQVYDVGDTMSENHQNQAFEVCYGENEYGSDTFHLADLNGATNGGTYRITFVDMAATW